MGSHGFNDNVYTRLGVKPLINANLPFTFLSATLLWPEVRAAMDEASRYFVDIVELQRGVGRRLSEISGAESGMVTSGAAGSIALATAACIAGADPERIWRLPDTAGLKHEVIMWGGRSIFDSAARLVDALLVVVDPCRSVRPQSRLRRESCQKAGQPAHGLFAWPGARERGNRGQAPPRGADRSQGDRGQLRQEATP